MATRKKKTSPSQTGKSAAAVPQVAEGKRLFDFGARELGPVFVGYLNRLHSRLRLAAGNRDMAVLFAYRAGIRIYDLYEVWLSARGLAMPRNFHRFKISRIAAFKAAFAANPSVALTAIGQELSGLDLHAVVSALLSPVLNGRQLPPIPPEPLHEFIGRSSETADALRTHLLEQSQAYEKYLRKISADAKRLILVDSGWRGTSQLVLEQGFPQYDFEGLYFGAMGRATVLGFQPRAMHGLVFDSELFDASKPETCFTLHRHLIESALEPPIPSVEMITGDDQVKSASIPEGSVIGPDPVYQGIRAYVKEHACDPVYEQERAYSVALSTFAAQLAYPTRQDAGIYGGKLRSHDLGRRGAAAPLLEPVSRFEGDTPDLRIAHALWAPGQAALEYEGVQLHNVQASLLKQLSVAEDGNYFHSYAENSRQQESARVAIITRTKNRPLLLARAAASVAAQTYTDYEWIVVNDGGNLQPVLDVIARSGVDPAKVTVCHNKTSLGMEAASNCGIRASSSEWIVIHDDDDSWDCRFLERAVGFMRQRGSVYSGVITHSTYVSEEICGNQVIERSRKPYNDWVRNVLVSEMATGNFFPPIAFLFSRRIWQEIGGFDEALPVLGDWDFNLRFLMQADIGVIPDALAYYHHRDVGHQNGAYSNSVIGGVHRHLEYGAIVRNKYLRLSASDPRMAVLASAVNSGHLQQDIRSRISSVANAAAAAATSAAAQAELSTPDGTRKRVNPLIIDELYRQLDERWAIIYSLAERHVKAQNMSIAAVELVDRSVKSLRSLITRYPPHPPADFDEAGYLAQNPDVAASVARGDIPSGFFHYLLHGAVEGRARACL